jgi:VIT1/CCC1 family predicted Fe2+/Mn2+ transporter
MAGLSLYFLVPFVLLLAILRVRAGHLEQKIRKYIKKNHPENVGEFSSPKGILFDEFKLVWSLYKKDHIEDPEFTRLKNKAKNAETYTFLAFLLGGLVIIVILINHLFYQ